MNPGICYLYEYEKNHRKRNVGFIKISRHYQSCILQIHARGIPVGNGAALELHAFYIEETCIVSAQIAVLNCFGRNISARLPVTETRFPDNLALSDIDGFLIRLPGDSHTVFWAASDKDFYADISHLRPPKADRPKDAAAKPHKSQTDTDQTGADQTDTDQTGADQTGTPATDETQNDQSAPAQTAPEMSDEAETAASDEVDSAVSGESDILAKDHDAPQDALPDNPPPDEISPSPSLKNGVQHSANADCQSLTARKIQRSDISSLPRRFWTLANNSFLLHGYHNYSHLLFVEEGGHMWLGVPGVYHPREARAADLFGFPQFTRSYVPIIGLDTGERNDDADFGHWCRYLGTVNDQ